MEGGATSLRGDMITELSPWNVIMQGIGIAPASYMDQLALNEDLIGKRKYNERRSALLQRLYLAKRFNDYGEEANVMDMIRRFNTSHPELRITPDVIKKSLQRQTTTTKNMVHGIEVNKQQRAVFMQEMADWGY